jgi:uncharacterized protein (DUF427 family)
MPRWSRPSPDPVGPGQESVWDYPRPPRLERSAHPVTVTHQGVLVASTDRPWRVLETAHAPAYYVPAAQVRTNLLQRSATRTVCEYKGVASYADLVLPDGTRVPDACWWYERPAPGYEAMAGAICFYPQRVDECTVDGEVVTPLQGSFYGDWPTSRIAGPYKGAPGTQGW